MSKVFIVQDTGVNFLPAAKFGGIEFLLPGDRNVMFSAGPCIHTLKQKLSAFSDKDFLLLTGDPVAIGAATAVAAMMNNGRVRTLKWDRQEKQYYPVEMIFYGKKGGDDGTA